MEVKLPASCTENEYRLLWTKNLRKHFPVKAPWLSALRGIRPAVKAVDDVGLEVRKGEILGVVGESGSGKSTLGRLMLRLLEPTSGQVFFEGRDLLEMGKEDLREFRRRVQIIFQDPYASLNPRMRVAQIVREPLDIYQEGTREDREQRVVQLLELVGLSPSHQRAFPGGLSGGQRQRVGIAAALALAPELVVADEPVSSLDVSVQAQILNLLADLQQQFGLTLVFISHDLSVVRHLCDRVAVMYLGKIVEKAPAEGLFEQPLHPYTQILLSAIPVPDPRQRKEPRVPEGEPPSPLNPPPGCSFHPRCPDAMRVCSHEEPQPVETGGHWVVCHLHT
jgi:oligopeptide/dipeptide ABC transporter ATP-binding protein